LAQDANRPAISDSSRGLTSWILKDFKPFSISLDRPSAVGAGASRLPAFDDTFCGAVNASGHLLRITTSSIEFVSLGDGNCRSTIRENSANAECDISQ
jgi:hypothetical protein